MLYIYKQIHQHICAYVERETISTVKGLSSQRTKTAITTIITTGATAYAWHVNSINIYILITQNSLAELIYMQQRGENNSSDKAETAKTSPINWVVKRVRKSYTALYKLQHTYSWYIYIHVHIILRSRWGKRRSTGKRRAEIIMTELRS